MSPQIKINLLPKQIEYYKLTKPALGVKYRCLAGSTGSGKTDGLIRIKVLKALKYNGIVICFFRKHLTTLRTTTLPSIIGVLEDMGLWEYCQYRKSPELIITLPNGSQLWFKQADKSKDPEFKSIRGLQVTDAVMEEADEMEEAVFSILLSRIGRLKNAEYGIEGEIDLLLNPSNGWVKTRFYEPYMAGELAKPFGFMEMSAKDNTYLPASFFEGLNYMTPEDKERYLNNNWNYKTNDNALIPYEWLKKVLVDQEYRPESGQLLYSLGVDVGGEGADKTIYAYSNGHCCYKFEEGTETNKSKIGYETLLKADNANIAHGNVSIDTIGEGSGVLDSLTYSGYKMRSYKSSHKAHNRGSFYKFGNKRAENYWKLRELVQSGQYFIVRDENLIQELTNTDFIKNSDGVYSLNLRRRSRLRLDGHQIELMLCLWLLIH